MRKAEEEETPVDGQVQFLDLCFHFTCNGIAPLQDWKWPEYSLKTRYLKVLQTHQFTVYASVSLALGLHERKKERKQQRWSFCLCLAMIIPQRSPLWYFYPDNLTNEVQELMVSSTSSPSSGTSLQVFMQSSWKEHVLLPDLLNSQCQDKGMQNVNCSDSRVFLSRVSLSILQS